MFANVVKTLGLVEKLGRGTSEAPVLPVGRNKLGGCSSHAELIFLIHSQEGQPGLQSDEHVIAQYVQVTVPR